MKSGLAFCSTGLLLAACCVLLASGCSHPDQPSAYGDIHQLTINDDAKGVAADLAARPTDLELPDDAGRTPLILAANQCSTNVLSLLLKKGAKMDAVASGRSTALHLAAQAGCAPAVILLIDNHCELNPHDAQNRTPMARAAQFGMTNIVTLLRAHGATE